MFCGHSRCVIDDSKGMGCCSDLASLVTMVLFNRLSKALATVTMARFITTQKTVAIMLLLVLGDYGPKTCL